MPCVCHLLIVCGSRVKIKMATNGDGSVSLIQLLRQISQTIRSVQRSIDVAVDVNSLQRNISIIEAVHIQLVRVFIHGFPLGEAETTQLRYKGNICLDYTLHVTSFPLHLYRGRVTELCRVPINRNYAVYLFLAIYSAAKLDLYG